MGNLSTAGPKEKPAFGSGGIAWPFHASMFFMLWAAVTIIVSLWIGQFALLPIPVLAVSAVIAFLLQKKFPVQMETSVWVVLLFVLMIILTSFPVLFLHQFIPVSSDALHVTNVRILGEKIPETYEPYSSLKFTYQIGFALFSNALVDLSNLIFFVPDYLVIWALGVLFSGLVVLFVYWSVKQITGNEQAALISAILVFGSKFVFQNFYYGVLPLVASFAFLLASILLYEKRSPLVFLLVPATFAIHTFTGIVLVGFLIVKTIVGRESKFGFLSLASLILVVPAFIRTYLTIFSNTPRQHLVFILSEFVKALSVVPLWVGIVPVTILLFFIFTLIVSKSLKLHELKQELLFVIFSFGSFILYLLMVSFQFEHGDKFIFSTSIFAILSVGVLFNHFKLSNLVGQFGRYSLVIVYISLLAVSLLSLSFSSDLYKAAITGTKSSVEEQNFAIEFKKFDSELKLTLFLNEYVHDKSDTHAGWLSIISNKIPYNVRTDHFVPDSNLQVVQDAGWANVLERYNAQVKIENCYKLTPSNDCHKLVRDTPVEYLVVNTENFSADYPFPMVFTYGNYVVYALK